MTSMLDCALHKLELEGRLLNAVLKEPTERPGRFGFRGLLALKFAPRIADEARPPELSADQVIAICENGQKTIAFFAAYLLSFGHLSTLVDVLDGLLAQDGKYFIFCDNLDLSAKYRVEMSGATFNVLPIDESTVYNELLEIFYLDKNGLKKRSVAGKTDAIADAAKSFSENYETISFTQGLERMGPVRNRNENRPV